MFKNKKINQQKTFQGLYSMGFLFALSMGIPLYVNSSYLSQFLTEQRVGFVYTAGSLVTVLVILLLPHILNRIGNVAALFFAGLLEIVFLIVLATSKNVPLIITAFIAVTTLLTMVMFHMDVFLEAYSKESKTGRIRGVYLTIVNLAILVSPLIAGFAVASENYRFIFVLAAACMLVMLFVLIGLFRGFRDERYSRITMLSSLKVVLRSRDLRGVFIANFLLQMFFAWMVIYSPLYLHEHVGFDWKQIGVMFTIMLLPYVLFELPLGRLADTKFGEKELMTAGLAIMGLATIAMSYALSPSIVLWTTLLFLSRVGGAMLEITSETYFFKHVQSRDSGIITLFRDARPFAYVIAPIFGVLFLYAFPFRYIFVVIGLIMLLGMRFTATIRDTR